MNIYLRELKVNRKSLIIWSIAMMLIVIMGMGKFGGMQSSGQSVEELLQNMPKSLQMLFGGGAFDLNSAIGFFSVMFLYVQLLSSIHAVMLGSSIIAKEERDRTYEFLITKPISRQSIITSKLLAVLTNVVILNLVTLISSLLIVRKYSPSEPVTGDIMIMFAGLIFVQVLFAAIGAAISSYRNFPKAAGGLSMGLMLLFFMLSVFADTVEQLTFLKYLTPFQYFSAKTLLVGEGFNPIYICITIIISAGLVYSTYRWYAKRDLGC